MATLGRKEIILCYLYIYIVVVVGHVERGDRSAAEKPKQTETQYLVVISLTLS